MNQPNKVEKVVTINKPAEELYRFWHKFANLPRFMKHLKDVKVYDDRRSHWISRGPLDSSIEWDAVITEDRENELISWASVQGADIDPSFVVTHRLPLEQAPHGYEIFKHKQDNCIKVVLKP